jgi:hypothetical protein
LIHIRAAKGNKNRYVRPLVRHESSAFTPFQGMPGILGQQTPDQTDVRAAHRAPLHDHDDACHGSYDTALTPSEFSPKNELISVALGGVDYSLHEGGIGSE